MNEQQRYALEIVGQQLDDSVFPRIMDGGLVLPSKPHIQFQHLGKELQNEQESPAPTASFQGSSSERWSGTASFGTALAAAATSLGERPPGASSPFALLPEHDELYGGVYAVSNAYPETEVHQVQEGFWLKSQSLLFPPPGRQAIFLTAINTRYRFIAGWGFWFGGHMGASWIGPRHTNYPDGSICAFEPNSPVWSYGDSLIELLDLYTLWAVRHLHLEHKGWWPGPQASDRAYERANEFQGREYCGCAQPKGRYATCCQATDKIGRSVQETLTYRLFDSRWVRKPPASVLRFASSCIVPSFLPNGCWAPTPA